jgi:para-aminobenzoate synthetase component 2
MILLIDNYDSFTWNLVQRIGELDPSLEVRVERNDRVAADAVEVMGPSHVIISPGPCTPLEAGVSNEIVRRFAGRIPLLGVCLGHQCIGHTHGMTVARHARIVHGKTSEVRHDGRGVFEGLPDPFVATRYHSLVVTRESVPDDGRWEVSAWTRETVEGLGEVEVVMGLRRVAGPGEAPMEGVQFHPESYLTPDGPWMLANFLGLERPAGTRAGTGAGAAP